MDKKVASLDVGLERDGFMRTLLHHLSGVLQDTIGLEESRGLVTVVGQVMGEELSQRYTKSLSLNKLPKNKLSSVLIDLKRRIKGDFYIISESEDKIVFGNRQCPFAERVLNRPSLCMMTTNVFGIIAANSVGYAKVGIEKAIANGDRECRVTVYLNPDNGETKQAIGREFLGES